MLNQRPNQGFVNVAKTESMLIGSRQRLPKLPLEPMMYVLRVIQSKEPVRDTKILELYIGESLTWSKHIEEITKNTRLQQELFL